MGVDSRKDTRGHDMADHAAARSCRRGADGSARWQVAAMGPFGRSNGANARRRKQEQNRIHTTPLGSSALRRLKISETPE